ncbi:hypothetical protein F511_06448 [Dorcoceras hygrometricum]|uniref:Uncharacterized protein n=1 Tax=Dorcoceras hygrometricum TaxID=472368 RepID=A0A2Z7B140_9LAMI|nr:hypothetical protein F511_06448 [Dorcoceras hygrometricum]
MWSSATSFCLVSMNPCATPFHLVARVRLSETDLFLFEDLNESADRHLAYFRTRYFLFPSPTPSKPLLFIEHYLLDLPSTSAIVWSKVGGAELGSLNPFDCYQLSDLSRLVGGERRNFSVREFLRQLIRDFLGSFELLDLSSQTVPAVFVETSEGADWRRLSLSSPGEIC